MLCFVFVCEFRSVFDLQRASYTAAALFRLFLGDAMISIDHTNFSECPPPPPPPPPKKNATFPPGWGGGKGGGG
eukprot:COSAG05_NODE_8796_length_670_cov_3.495622_1_plen_73_part_10